jgi:hypothetical protein
MIKRKEKEKQCGEVVTNFIQSTHNHTIKHTCAHDGESMATGEGAGEPVDPDPVVPTVGVN